MHEKSILKTKVLQSIIGTTRPSTAQHKRKSKLLKSSKQVTKLSSLFQCYPVRLQDPVVFFSSLSATLVTQQL